VGARQKLSAAFLNGCMLASGLAGLVARSRMPFGLALIVTVALSCHSGEIRHRPGPQHASRGR
jgi:hypothetical protein